MNHKTIKSLVFGFGILSLTACRTELLDLSGAIAQVSGQVNLSSSSGQAVQLSSATGGRAISASIYDNNGMAAMSLQMDGVSDSIDFQLDQSTSDFKTAVDALDAHANSANQSASVALTAGTNQPVTSTWDGSDSCVVSQYQVTVCDNVVPAAAPIPPGHNPLPPPNNNPPPPPPKPACHQELKTVYGTATFEYVKSGVIYHDLLKISQSSASVVIDLIDDQTSTSSTQISSCIP